MSSSPRCARAGAAANISLSNGYAIQPAQGGNAIASQLQGSVIVSNASNSYYVVFRLVGPATHPINETLGLALRYPAAGILLSVQVCHMRPLVFRNMQRALVHSAGMRRVLCLSKLVQTESSQVRLVPRTPAEHPSQLVWMGTGPHSPVWCSYPRQHDFTECAIDRCPGQDHGSAAL